tara:strand:+ start:76 stop:408 length:333 start_codon:yes stop_codon:yes gene_type:complete
MRYKKDNIILNTSDYYAPFRQTRGLKAIRQYGTVRVNHPTLEQRRDTPSDTYIWGYGDRLYNLAYQYYGDERFWWVIAWWNGYPLEANIHNGAALTIPTDLERALKVLGY